MKYWFVNQSHSYTEERKGNYLYSPKYTEDGRKRGDSLLMLDVDEGDIIFCNKSAYIVSIAKAKSRGYESEIPSEIEGMWPEEGYKIDLEYIDIQKPLRFSDYKDIYMENINLKSNPFRKNGTAKLLYFSMLDCGIAELFLDKINDKYINSFIDESRISVFEEMQELREEEELNENISYGRIKKYSKEEMQEKENAPFEYVETKKESKSQIIRKTDGKLRATVIDMSGYECEIDCNHKTFTDGSGVHQYLEAHHIIPIEAQKDFPDVNLDSYFNLIAICPNCHKKVHYALLSEKSEIFAKMYNLRKEEMLKHGFDIARINEIFNKYYMNK